MGFIVKLVLVLALVAGGVWAWMTFYPSTPAQPVAETQTPSSAPPAPPPAPKDAVSLSGSSDTDLEGDLNTLDGQVQSAQDANASVDGSFNDKPVQQTE